MGFEIEVRFRNAAQKVGKLRGEKRLVGQPTVLEGGSGQQLVRVEAEVALDDRFLNGADQRMIRRSLGADVSEEGGTAGGTLRIELVHQHPAADGDLFREPRGDERTLGEPF